MAIDYQSEGGREGGEVEGRAMEMKKVEWKCEQNLLKPAFACKAVAVLSTKITTQ